MSYGYTLNVSGIYTRTHAHVLIVRVLWTCCLLTHVLLACVARWSGRNHREKIGVHVKFEQELNMEPYCCKDSASNTSLHHQHFLYQLSAVVMHHGKGFGSGHYTAFCYNTEGGRRRRNRNLKIFITLA